MKIGLQNRRNAYSQRLSAFKRHVVLKVELGNSILDVLPIKINNLIKHNLCKCNFPKEDTFQHSAVGENINYEYSHQFKS